MKAEQNLENDHLEWCLQSILQELVVMNWSHQSLGYFQNFASFTEYSAENSPSLSKIDIRAFEARSGIDPLVALPNPPYRIQVAYHCNSDCMPLEFDHKGILWLFQN